jgi:hypothetical protein
MIKRHKVTDAVRIAYLCNKNKESPCRHEAGFYSDDEILLDSFTQFIVAALKAGITVILLATASHRDSLRSRLQTYSLDTRVLMRTGNLAAVMRTIEHRDVKTAMQYQHAELEVVRAALDYGTQNEAADLRV